MLLKCTTVADRNTRNAAGRSQTPDPTEAATNSRPTSVAEAVPAKV